MRFKIAVFVLFLASFAEAQIGPIIMPPGGAGGGDALTSNPLSQFAATTCAQFAGVITSETGTCGSVVLSTAPTFGGTVTFGTISSNTGILKMFHASNAFYTQFTNSATQDADAAYILPVNDGAANEFLQTNGSGLLSWAAATAGITIGTTAITSGTSTRILRESSGNVVTEDANLVNDGATVTIGTGIAAASKALIVNGATSTGNILEVQDNGVAVFTIADGATAATQNNNGYHLTKASGIGLDWATDSTSNKIAYSTTNTPDTSVFNTQSTSNAWHVWELFDSFDFNNGRCLTATCTNPSVIIHSPDQTTTEYLQLSTDATGAGKVQSNFGEVTVGAFKSNITEASAQVIVRITMPSSGIFSAQVNYLVSDGDGTDFVGRGGSIIVQGANKAGTSVCTINAGRDTEAEDGSEIVNAAGAFTLTYTWTNVVNTTSCDISLNAASSAGANTLDIQYTVVLTGTSNAISVNPQ